MLDDKQMMCTCVDDIQTVVISVMSKMSKILPICQ